MNANNFCNSMLRDLRAIQMSERTRAQAENGVRRSAAFVEALAGMASYVGFRGNAKQRS